MPPKQSSAAANRRPRGGAASKAKAPKTGPSPAQTETSRSFNTTRSDNGDVDDPFADDEVVDSRGDNSMEVERSGEGDDDDDEDDVDAKKTIPPELLTRILHEFFEKDGTRISKDANKAVAKYMDIFVREAIARTAVEKGNGFLEVEDLEKVAPQLLMDL